MYIDEARSRYVDLNLMNSNIPIPCTSKEIEELERFYNFSLPLAYREFLLWMGHGAGSFLQGTDCFYSDLFHIREWSADLLTESEFSEKLPANAFVFLMHQGYQFMFFLVGQDENPSIYFYMEMQEQKEFKMLYKKFTDFLLEQIEIHANARF